MSLNRINKIKEIVRFNVEYFAPQWCHIILIIVDLSTTLSIKHPKMMLGAHSLALLMEAIVAWYYFLRTNTPIQLVSYAIIGFMYFMFAFGRNIKNIKKNTAQLRQIHEGYLLLLIIHVWWSNHRFLSLSYFPPQIIIDIYISLTRA